MNEDTAGTNIEPVLPAYAGPVQRRKFRRIKLGLLLASLAACLIVAVLGFLCAGAISLGAGVTGAGRNYSLLNEKSFRGGLMMAFQLSAYNFILFFITVPAAWLALGLSVGRFPYRGIVHRAPYFRWGLIWGAILVGGTTGGVGLIIAPITGLGAAVTGALVGALAGALCGLLFYAIVKPANQFSEVDLDVF